MARRKLSTSRSAPPSDVLHQFGAQLKRLREDRHITQRVLAERCGFSTKHMGAVERGQSEPGTELLVKCARALGVPVGELFETITPGDAATRRLAPSDVDAIKAALSTIGGVVDRVTSGQSPKAARRPARKRRT